MNKRMTKRQFKRYRMRTLRMITNYMSVVEYIGYTAVKTPLRWYEQ